MFLVDGFQSLVTFASAPGILLREMEVKPPFFKGGGPIDVTSMRNVAWITKLPKWLVEIDELDMVVQYDPVVYGPVVPGFGNPVTSIINFNQLITIRFPDLSIVAFNGWIDEFVPQSMKKGELPLADMKIHISNVGLLGGSSRQTTQGRNPPGIFETAPVYTAPPAINLSAGYATRPG